MRAVIVLMTILTGCTGMPSGDEGPVRLPGRLELPEQDLAGYRALVASLEGTPVVVNIWGSWCPPCRDEAPHLAALARKHEGQVQFLGVDILDEREAAKGFIREFELPYPSVFDPDAEIRDGLGYLGQPVTIVHDREGEIVFEKTGAVSERELGAAIEEVL